LFPAPIKPASTEMPRQTYPFYTFRTARKKPYLPIIARNPMTGQEASTLALIDTGADVTVFPSWLTDLTGHDLMHYQVKTSITSGLGKSKIPVYRHSFVISILKPDFSGVFCKFRKRLIDCVEDFQDEIPPLLGQDDILAKFKITIDYPNSKTILEY